MHYKVTFQNNTAQAQLCLIVQFMFDDSIHKLFIFKVWQIQCLTIRFASLRHFDHLQYTFPPSLPGTQPTLLL